MAMDEAEENIKSSPNSRLQPLMRQQRKQAVGVIYHQGFTVRSGGIITSSLSGMSTKKIKMHRLVQLLHTISSM
ncbi:unnamed protein product [Blumeria hordei]|uniref:Uncharacterized protein n=1 Tax=Blumeria hordei TaxID=2867405 RepID=A0A383UQR4_BLUHO|nr:unnamed protein product [Blumeria hordei]